MISSGEIRPVIERIYSLIEVPEAMRHIGAGLVKGKIVVMIDRMV